jgi:hypothetical protein
MVKRVILKRDKPHSEAIRRTSSFIKKVQQEDLECGLQPDHISWPCYSIFELFENNMMKWAQELEDVQNRKDSERVLESLHEHKEYVRRGFSFLQHFVCQHFLKFKLLIDFKDRGLIKP